MLIRFILFSFLFMLSSIYAQVDYNKLNNNGQKSGNWRGFYSDTKNLKYEGSFLNGKEVGLFTFYDNNKVKIIIATSAFNANDNSAYTIFYDAAKNVVSEGNIVDKLHEGKWRFYHKSSKKLMTIENYSKGKLQGLRSVFYPSGKIVEEAIYKDNLKHGFYKRYTEAGIIIEECTYKNNDFDGLAIFRDTDQGTIVSRGKFVNGKKSGIWKFFEKGKLVREENMSASRLSQAKK